jgi:hypothetical protein
VKPSRMLLALLAITAPSICVASSHAKGWQEQTWRATYLAQQERWRIVVKFAVKEPGGDIRSKGAINIMRGGLSAPEQGSVDGAVFVDLSNNVMAYMKGDGKALLLEGKVKSTLVDEDAWWKSHSPAQSRQQWMSWLIALPARPSQGDCSFRNWKHTVVLPLSCLWDGNRITWSDWLSAKASPDFDLWIPQVIEVERPDHSVVTIQVATFEMRSHGEGADGWPFEDDKTKATTRHEPLQDPEIPLEDMDYRSW